MSHTISLKFNRLGIHDGPPAELRSGEISFIQANRPASV
jgi:hypothetical protein